jgi:hypothetical protein
MGPKQIKPFDESSAEEWVRDVPYNSPGGAGAVKGKDGGWAVSVDAAEFVREEPLESEMRTCVREALLTVAGVTSVEEEDREVWRVEGTPTGPDLLTALGAALDTLEEKFRAHMESLG